MIAGWFRLMLLLFLRAAGPVSAQESLCPQVVFLGEDAPKLSETEHRLVCGDPKSEAWRRIPLNQARYFLRAFLQQRGYHDPWFKIRDEKLWVDPGARSYIESFATEGLPPEVRISRRRGVVGELMVSSVLDRHKAWLTNSLQNRGYGCPEVKVSADARSGVLRADVDPGPVHVPGDIVEARAEEVDPGVFRRYEAFRHDKPVDLRLLTLTSRRVMSEDLFFSAYYDLVCSTERQLTVVQRVTPAPPRVLSAGFGVDTEGFIRVRARWRHARIGRSASSLQGTIFASYYEQSGEALMRWYFKPESRFHLVPRASGERDNEQRYETLSSKASVQPAFSWDNQSLRVEARAGPGFEYIRTLRGQGPADSNFFLIDTQVDLMSHLYEYNLHDPQIGWVARIETSMRQERVHSPFTAHWLRLTGAKLWNLGHYDPPLFVLGWRGLAATTLVDEAERAVSDLPPTLRFFLGGDSDIRGFSRRQLPPDDNGFLTAAYQGIELRMVDVLPFKVQPLLFIDAAMGGREDLSLDPNVYWAPGFGARWASPFGSMRATLARGATWERAERQTAVGPQWQFFFSFGVEF